MKHRILPIVILLLLFTSNCAQKKEYKSIIQPEVNIQDTLYYEVLDVFHNNDSINFSKKDLFISAE